MRVTVLLLMSTSFVWPSFGNAQYFNANPTKSSQNIAASSKARNVDCFLCDWSVAPEIAVVSRGEVCEDLSASSCLDEKGNYKSKIVFDRIEERLRTYVKKAYDVTAQSMGYLNHNDALFKTLKKEGFELKNDLSDKAKKFLFENDYKNYVDKTEIFEIADRCRAEQDEISNISYYNVTGVEKLKELIQKYDKFASKYRSYSLQYFAKDIPGLVNKIGQQCNELKTQEESLKDQNLLGHPTVLKLQKLCSQRNELRNKAVNLYRRQGDSKAQKETIKFVHDVQDVLYLNFDRLNSAESEDSESDTEKLASRLSGKLSSAYEVCQSLEATLDSGPKTYINNTFEVLSTARPTVEYLIDQVYTPQRKTKFKKIYLTTKLEAYKIAQRLTRDPQKLARIHDHFRRMDFGWLEKPSDNQYVKSKLADIQVLKIDKIDPTDLISSMFSDRLENFTLLNAFYIPDIKIGTRETPLRVTMLPMFLEIMDEIPHAFLNVLAHEVGHNLSPNITSINGYDLIEEYKPLLRALSSPGSIRMESIQADEAVADVVSAEVLASLISQLPSGEPRRSAIIASMQAFCKFISMSDESMEVTPDASHPESIMRVSGLYGANRNVRKALSCSGDAKEYNTYSLEGGL